DRPREQFFELCRFLEAVMMIVDVASGRCPHVCKLVNGSVQCAAHGICKCDFIASGHKPTGLSWLDQFGNAGDVCRDDRSAKRHGLHYHDGHILGKTRQQKCARGLDLSLHLLTSTPAGKDKMTSELSLSDSVFDL